MPLALALGMDLNGRTQIWGEPNLAFSVPYDLPIEPMNYGPMVQIQSDITFQSGSAAGRSAHEKRLGFPDG